MRSTWLNAAECLADENFEASGHANRNSD